MSGVLISNSNNFMNTSTYSNGGLAALDNLHVELVDNQWMTVSEASNSSVSKKLDDIKDAIKSNQSQLVQIKHTISALMSSYLLTLNNNIKNMGFASYDLRKTNALSTYDACQPKSFYPFIVDILKILFDHNGEQIFKDYDCIAVCDRRELVNAMSNRYIGVVYMSMILKTDIYGRDDLAMLQKQFVDFVFADKQWKKLLAVSIPIPLNDDQLVHIMLHNSNGIAELADNIERSYFGKIIISTNKASEKDNATELTPVFWSYSVNDVKKVLKDMDKKLNS